MNAPLRVGLAGLGTVGSAVAGMLLRTKDKLAVRAGRPIDLVAIASKDPPRDQSLDLSSMRQVNDPVALAKDSGIDVFVELMGGSGDPAKAAVEAALGIGRPVVSANKALIAKHGTALIQLAEQHNAAFNFEAAVGGGIPVIKTLREGLGGAEISRVYGILNGTCNYILTTMQKEGRSFEDCLQEAQKLGYAEADPTFDIGGFDTAHKIAILASLAFGAEVDADAVYVEGIQSITLADLEAADDLGYRVKLLGVAVKTATGIEQRVHPTMVPKGSVIAEIDGVTNAVAINSDALDLRLVGPGGGGAATASAVVADIVDLASGRRVAPFGRGAAKLTKALRAPMQDHEGGYYIRLAAVDKPGTAASIAGRMAEQGISLESIVQRRRDKKPSSDAPAPVVLITYATNEDAMRHALAAIKKDGVLAAEPQVIRIEKN
jgi:homoserine dehydrogenase